MDSWLGRLDVRLHLIWSSSALRLYPILHVVCQLSRIPLLFWSRSEEWPSSWWKSFCKYRQKRGISITFPLIVFIFTIWCHWTSKWRWFVLWIVLVRSYCSWTLGLCWWAAMRWTLGTYSTRIPSALRQLCTKLCIVMNLWTNSTVVPTQYLILGTDSPFQDITQNLTIRKTLQARDWWLLHHWPKIIVSMKSLPNQLESLQKSHLIVRLSTFSGMSNTCFNVRLFPVFLIQCKFSE